MALVHQDDLAAELDSGTLRIIGALAEQGTITAAAASLGLSQPAVSQHLRRLEARLGVAVIERRGRGVRLTEAGRILAEHAVTVIRALDAAASEIHELTGLRSGRVRIAAFPSASSAIVPTLLGELARIHPSVTVTFVEAEPPEAVAAVRAGDADLAITFSYPGDPADPHLASAVGLRVDNLWSDRMMLVLPAAHPAAAQPIVAIADLADERWIAGCPRCRGHLLGLCASSGFEPVIAHETDNVAAVTALVAAGLGVALLPSLALRSSVLPPGAVARPTGRGDERMLHLVGSGHAERIPAVAATMRIVAGLTPTFANASA
ncbi:LysR family transcriptional regulator [Plantibacter sp. YIM 135249]|uniref:LysR family transcriptional regulator n=1 Tax=Plantibacter sp. YIM 135249 TaxID=3423918 RepID=UPI003D34014D